VVGSECQDTDTGAATDNDYDTDCDTDCNRACTANSPCKTLPAKATEDRLEADPYPHTDHGTEVEADSKG